jgi:hypothetical protein
MKVGTINMRVLFRLGDITNSHDKNLLSIPNIAKKDQ